MKEENKKDIVVKIRARQIENGVIATLRTVALEQLATKKLRRFSQNFSILRKSLGTFFCTEHQVTGNHKTWNFNQYITLNLRIENWGKLKF